MCEHCGGPGVHIDAYKTSTRVVQQVDMIFDSLTKPVLSKVSQSTKDWSELIGENEFIDKKAVIKRVSKYEKRWIELFKDWKRKFKQAVKDKQGGMFGFFSKRELTYDDRVEILDDVYDAGEIEEMYYEMYVQGEMTEDHRYAVKKIAEKEKKELDPLMLIVVGWILTDFSEFGNRASVSITNTAREKSTNLIIYGIEQGKTTKEIAKDVVEKFDYYIEKEGQRIARTEAIRAMNKGLQSGFDRMGVKYYEIIHCLDACTICVSLAANGPYKTEDKCGIPAHPSCRCCIVPVLG